MPLPSLPPRRAESHKGDYGRVLVIGGSRGMAGAVGLAAVAALRAGAGRVTVAVPRGIQPVVASYEPSYMTGDLDEDDEGRIAPGDGAEPARRIQQADVVAIGPGMGRSIALERWVRDAFAHVVQPMVIDADGLNALAAAGEPPAPGGPRVLTPHPGEFARLSRTRHEDRLAMERAAVAWAKRHRVVLVLKGHRSLITDGERTESNETGNPGMATGGTGDVLTGVVAALLGQGLDPWDAARLASHLHGRAGDLAAGDLGQTALIASDLPRYLPRAFMECER
ncbi:MAG: NAD(P)H-hydrate dehydratase [Planctomycetes bacterium]|nr:NAD(P)H-hydrate dehydratase [Planctomycetota bacterium]